MAECAGEVERVASGAELLPKGVVRITAPPGVAFLFLAPLAAHIREVLPDVRLEVMSTVHYVDLARREADLAIRGKPIGRPSNDHDLVCLATYEQTVGAYATPEFIARLPQGYGFSDVGWIGWSPPFEDLPPNPMLAARIPGFRPVFAADDYIVQLRAAEAGVGAVLLGRFASRFALPTPLVEFPLPEAAFKWPAYLTCARSSLAVPRIRAVADVLAAEFAFAASTANAHLPTRPGGDPRRPTRKAR